MPLELIEKKSRGSLPVHLVAKDGLESAGLEPSAAAWAGAMEVALGIKRSD